MQVGAAEIAAVHEEELVAQGLAGAFGPSHIAPQGGDAGFGADVHDVSHDGGPQEVLDAEFITFGGLYHMDVPAVVREREGNVGPGEGHALELFHDVAQFHVVALQEFAPGGNVVEEIADADVGAHRAAHLAGPLVLGTGHDHLYTGLFGGDTGAERDFGHGGNGGQGLSAEAEGEDVVQVFGRCEFAGGMPLEAQDGIVRGHAAAVVDDLDERAAGIGNHHFLIRGTGVHRILHEFLHDGSGPLDHFPRSNHIGDILRQYP